MVLLKIMVFYVLRFSNQFFQCFQSSYHYQHQHAVFNCALFFNQPTTQPPPQVLRNIQNGVVKILVTSHVHEREYDKGKKVKEIYLDSVEFKVTSLWVRGCQTHSLNKLNTNV